MNAWFVRPEPHSTYRPSSVTEVSPQDVGRNQWEHGEWVTIPFFQVGHEEIELAVDQYGRVGQLNGSTLLVPVQPSQWDEFLGVLS